jgi:hypothetical protein
MIRTHCYSVSHIRYWYSFVGSLVCGAKLFCSINMCTILFYSSVLMMTIDLLFFCLDFYCVIFSKRLFICFMMYSCHLCFGFWLLLVLILWFSIFVAKWPYVFCIFKSSTFMALSVSIISLVRYESREVASTSNDYKITCPTYFAF